MGFPLWDACRACRRQSAGGFAALALHEFRLQPALRLLLRAFIAHRAPTGTGARTRAADCSRSRGAWRQRNLRDRRRAVSAGRHRRDSAFLRCSHPDHGADQRNVVYWAARGSLRALPRDRIVLQISLDSATPELHDLHRGPGTWARTREGIQRARAHGFRVRLAATVSTDAEAEAFRQFLDEEKIAAEDRVIRRIALRGAASEGVAVTRADLVPEVTITVEGVYWHPVGAEDSDLLITRDIFPLAESFAAVRRAFDREGEHANKLARIFNCA